MKVAPGGSSGSLHRDELRERKEKKVTLKMPQDMHKQLKMIAASNSTTARDLLIEAVLNHTMVKYGAVTAD